MSQNKPPIGSIAWVDQASAVADEVRDFYAAVVGWSPSPVSMGDYADYSMLPPNSDQAIAGICHLRGQNADLPTGWLIYIIVENLDLSLAECLAHGGSVLVGPKAMGGTARYAIIKDPGGAIAALYAS